MRQHQSILEFARVRYLLWALVLCVVVIAAYSWHEPPAVYLKPYGGTWLGYTLGILGALIILWLMLLGVRKRSYRSTLGSVQGWVSAHVYLGTSLIIIATLHSGFEFGWNIHTLAYVLMMLVIGSGFFGVFSYLRYPAHMTANVAGETLQTMLLKVADGEKKCARIALELPDEVNAAVDTAVRQAAARSPLGASFWRQLKGGGRRHPMRLLRDRLVTRSTKDLSAVQAKAQEQLVAEMSRVVSLRERIGRDLQYRALLQVWLYFHVPLSFALLAALTAHVISVFYFW